VAQVPQGRPQVVVVYVFVDEVVGQVGGQDIASVGVEGGGVVADSGVVVTRVAIDG